MTPEHKAKLKAGREARSAQFVGQFLQVDKYWSIRRLDDMNWEIQFNGKFFGYYPTIWSALKALPGKMVNQTAFDSIQKLETITRAISETIDKAAARAEFYK